MKKHNRPQDRDDFWRALDDLLDQWWDLELLSEVAHWVKKIADNKGHDPGCECHDYCRYRLRMAIRALRIWREREHAQPQPTAEEDLALLDDLLEENTN